MPVYDQPGLRDVPQAEPQPDQCGPEPQKPNYYSPQAVRDAYYRWQLCKQGG